MATHETHISQATPADIAADMEHHRSTYLNFLNLMKWVIVGSVIILVILFFIFD